MIERNIRIIFSVMDRNTLVNESRHEWYCLWTTNRCHGKSRRIRNFRVRRRIPSATHIIQAHFSWLAQLYPQLGIHFVGFFRLLSWRFILRKVYDYYFQSNNTNANINKWNYSNHFINDYVFSCEVHKWSKVRSKLIFQPLAWFRQNLVS